MPKKLSVWNWNELKEAFAGKVYALTSVYSDTQDESGRLYRLGVAVANEGGYSPVPLNWIAGTEAEVDAEAERLNAELGLNEEAAEWIVASTIAGPARKESA